MNSKPKLLFDMDGTIVNLLPTWLKIYNKCSGESLAPADIKEYDFQSYVKDVPLFDSCLLSALAEAEKMPHFERFKNLSENLRVQVKIVTHLHKTVRPSGYAVKFAWVQEFLPKFDMDNFIIINGDDRGFLQGDALVDDAPTNLAKFSSRNETGLSYCVAQPYNQYVGFSANFRGTLDEIIGRIERRFL